MFAKKFVYCQSPLGAALLTLLFRALTFLKCPTKAILATVEKLGIQGEFVKCESNTWQLVSGLSLWLPPLPLAGNSQV